MKKRQKRPNTAVTFLLVSAGLVFLLIVTGVLYLVAMGSLNARAPRTAAERQLQYSQSKLDVNDEDALVWQQYINALNLAGDYRGARQAYREALRSVPASEPVAFVHIAYANVLLKQERTDDALDEVDTAIDKAIKYQTRERKAIVDSGVTKNSPAYMGAGSEALIQCYVLRANIYQIEKKWAQVVEATTAAIKLEPNAADVITQRGVAYLAMGKKTEARTDFVKAASFGQESARRELEKLGN